MAKVKGKPKTKDKKITPFQVLNGMNTWQENRYSGFKTKGQRLFSSEEVKESGLSFYLLLQFIKNSKQLQSIAVYLNDNYKMNLYDAYLLCFFTFRYLELGGIEWIKADKADKIENVELIQKFYKVKRREAYSYLDNMSDKEILIIKQFYNPKAKK